MRPSQPALLQIVAACVTFLAGSAHGVVIITWNGGTGDWDDATKWTGGVPNDIAADVFIDGGKAGASTVTVPSSVTGAFRAGRVTIDAGDTLNIADGQLQIGSTGAFGGEGTIVNAGTLSLTSRPFFRAELRIGNSVGSSLELSGGGSVVLSGETGTTDTVNDSVIKAGTSQGALLHNNDNTIRGHGFIGTFGSGELRFWNGGIVNADVAGRRLYIQTPNVVNGAINSGIMEATNGGILDLWTMNLNLNNNGTILSDGVGSLVLIEHQSYITGGTLNTLNGGLIRAAAGSFSNITNAGSLEIARDNLALGNAEVGLGGTINNTGQILVRADTLDATLKVLPSPDPRAPAVTLTGGGRISLSGTGNQEGAKISSGVLTYLVNSNNIIEGYGNVGAGALSIISNAGTIDANVSGKTLTVAPSQFQITNTGTMSATGGGTLRLLNAFIVGGTIRADGTNSVVALSNSTSVRGGTLVTSNGGVIRNTSEGNGNVLQYLTLAARLEVADSSELSLLGNIHNTGEISLINAGNNTRIKVGNGFANETTTLTGAGTITLGGTSETQSELTYGAATQTLINEDNLIHGFGLINATSAPQNLAIVNRGRFEADVAGKTLKIGGDSTNFRNATGGLMRASNGGILELTAGLFESVEGKIEAATGGIVRLTGAVTMKAENGGEFVAGGGGNIEAVGGGNIFAGDGGNIVAGDGGNIVTGGGGNIAAAGGGNIEANGGTVRNTGSGVIEANGGSIVAGGGGNIVAAGGGNIVASGGGNIVAGGGGNILAGSGGNIVARGGGSIVAGGGGNIHIPGGGGAASALAAADEPISMISVTGTGKIIANAGGSLQSGPNSAFNGPAQVMSGGRLIPGTSSGASTMVWNGNLTLENGSHFEINVGGLRAGTEYDVLDVNGASVLDGDVLILMLHDFNRIAKPDDTFDVLTADTAIIGTIDNLVGGRIATADGYGSFAAAYTNEGKTLTLSDFRSVPLTYAMWLQAMNFATPEDEAETADPDGDGVPNLAEYALAMDGNAKDPQRLPDVGVRVIGASRFLTLTYVRPAGGGAATDIAYRVERSTSLASGSWSPSGVLQESVTFDPATSTETVVMGSTTPVAAGQEFLRFAVSKL